MVALDNRVRDGGLGQVIEISLLEPLLTPLGAGPACTNNWAAPGPQRCRDRCSSGSGSGPYRSFFSPAAPRAVATEILAASPVDG